LGFTLRAIKENAMSEPFIAEIRIFAGNFAPRNWAFCNGQLLPISQNTALFSLIGTIYGGDGRTTTALPNLQGRAPMHAGQGPGLSNRRIGENGGVENVTLTLGQMPNHNHAMTASPNPGETPEPGTTSALARSVGSSIYGADSNLVAFDAATMPNAGGSQAHNNLQPFLTLNFIIALAGLYPPRN
jgi:microcystin-dependent protein